MSINPDRCAENANNWTLNSNSNIIQVCYVPGYEVEYGVCLHMPHEVGASSKVSQSPGKVPAVAVEHRHNYIVGVWVVMVLVIEVLVVVVVVVVVVVLSAIVTIVMIKYNIEIVAQEAVAGGLLMSILENLSMFHSTILEMEFR